MPTSPASGDRTRRRDQVLDEERRRVGADRNRNAADRQRAKSRRPASRPEPAQHQPGPQAVSAQQDRDEALRRAVELIRRPVPRHQRRQVERVTRAAEILARQLMQRTSSRRGRGR